METVVVSLICIALVVFGGMTMSRGFLTSVDSSTVGLEQMSTQNEQIMRTELSTVSSSMNAGRDTLYVSLQNNGQTKLADFDKWDVIVQYYAGDGTYYTKWLPYNSGTLGDNEWQVQWIHLDGVDEVFELNILNPGEEIQIEAKLDPAIGAGTTNLVVVSTPNGVPASIAFSP